MEGARWQAAGVDEFRSTDARGWRIKIGTLGSRFFSDDQGRRVFLRITIFLTYDGFITHGHHRLVFNSKDEFKNNT
jgi:hypothetical protein